MKENLEKALGVVRGIKTRLETDVLMLEDIETAIDYAITQLPEEPEDKF